MRSQAGLLLLLAFAMLLLLPEAAAAHGVSRGDARFLQSLHGAAIAPLMYLGARHMITGYDHLLFLVGVIFFLYRLKDVLLSVSLFTIGHSVTLLAGVLGGLHANAFIVDAIIGLSIVYKAFENMGGFRRLGWQPDSRAAVLIFGLCHGFGLATKLQEFALPSAGLVANIVSFNVGVELGQIAALSAILIGFTFWRRHPSFARDAFSVNVALMTAGVALASYQMNGYLDARAAAADEARPRAAAASVPSMTMFKVDRVVFTLRPSEGFEYKYRVEQGAGLVYAWTATQRVKYEFHGEHDGAGLGVAVSYEKGDGTRGSGSFVAPAPGIHGWFWENTSDEPMTLTLTSSGFYSWADEFRQRFDPVKHKGIVERTRHELSEPAEK